MGSLGGGKYCHYCAISTPLAIFHNLAVMKKSLVYGPTLTQDEGLPLKTSALESLFVAKSRYRLRWPNTVF